MMRGIVFSKDRATQCEAVLRSLYLHCKDITQAKITVLYLCSNEQHQRQYYLLEQTYPHIEFIKQDDFRTDLLKWINPYPPDTMADRLFRLLLDLSQTWYSSGKWLKRAYRIAFGQYVPWLLPESREEYLLFLTDDNIFVRDFYMREVTDALRNNPEALGFSLRLGVNISYTYMHDHSQPLPYFTELPNTALKYKWPIATDDFGYALEISSSVYRAGELAPYILGLAFHNPNELEAEMAARKNRFVKRFPELLCFSQSVTFCNPINKVQQAFDQNRASQIYFYSPDELAARFELGDRIRVETYSGFVPVSCHQEVELFFEHKGNIS